MDFVEEVWWEKPWGYSTTGAFPNVTYTTLIDGYCKTNEVEQALKMLLHIIRKISSIYLKLRLNLTVK